MCLRLKTIIGVDIRSVFEDYHASCMEKPRQTPNSGWVTIGVLLVPLLCSRSYLWVTALRRTWICLILGYVITTRITACQLKSNITPTHPDFESTLQIAPPFNPEQNHTHFPVPLFVQTSQRCQGHMLQANFLPLLLYVKPIHSWVQKSSKMYSFNQFNQFSNGSITNIFFLLPLLNLLPSFSSPSPFLLLLEYCWAIFLIFRHRYSTVRHTMVYLKMAGETVHMGIFFNDVIKLPGKVMNFPWLA